MLAKGKELVGGYSGIQQQVAWSPVHHGWGTIRLLQHHNPSSVLSTQPFREVSGCQRSFDFVLFNPVANDLGWQWWVAFLTFSNRVTLEGM